VTESELLDLISKLSQPSSAQLVRGIGDDAAIWRPKPGEDLVFTTDFLIEGVHFLQQPRLAMSRDREGAERRSSPSSSATRNIPLAYARGSQSRPCEAGVFDRAVAEAGTYSAVDIGHKLLARGLSDIAAMGAEPRFCLVSLALSPACDRRWVKSFYTGLLGLASRYNTALAGGDLSHNDRVAADIVVCGAVPRGKALRRDTARAGDAIYVSAPLGRDWSRYRRPEPRVELGLQLRGKATAAMDITDGLALDLHRLCKASNGSADLTNIPVRRGSTQEQALHGGEDYELLWTAPSRAAQPQGSIRIGTIVKGASGRIKLNGAEIRPRGYDHFAT
jgi:thiamine-monophosphate kinase